MGRNAKNRNDILKEARTYFLKPKNAHVHTNVELANALGYESERVRLAFEWAYNTLPYRRLHGVQKKQKGKGRISWNMIRPQPLTLDSEDSLSPATRTAVAAQVPLQPAQPQDSSQLATMLGTALVERDKYRAALDNIRTTLNDAIGGA